MPVSWMIVKLNHSCLALYSKMMKGLKGGADEQVCLILRLARGSEVSFVTKNKCSCGSVSDIGQSVEGKLIYGDGRFGTIYKEHVTEKILTYLHVA